MSNFIISLGPAPPPVMFIEFSIDSTGFCNTCDPVTAVGRENELLGFPELPGFPLIELFADVWFSELETLPESFRELLSFSF
jgi:hypothetical protein